MFGHPDKSPQQLKQFIGGLDLVRLGRSEGFLGGIIHQIHIFQGPAVALLLFPVAAVSQHERVELPLDVDLGNPKNG